MTKLTVGSEQGKDIEINYEAYGSGDPVVLIHGWPLSGRSWEAQVPALVQAGKRVITYDRRGFGASSQPWEGYDYDTFAADLHALIEHLDLRHLTLVGFSMGGGEVARYVATHGSERVRCAVFAAAVPPFLHQEDGNPEGPLDDATVNSWLEALSGDRIAFLDEFMKNFFAAGERTDLISEPARLYHREIAAFASPKATRDCVKAFAYTDFRPDLERFDIPTLVLHGDSDGIVPFTASGKRTAAAITGAEVVVVAGAPHGFNATHAKEFNEALVKFVS